VKTFEREPQSFSYFSSLISRKALRRAYLQGASFGLAGAFMFFANASVFKYGGHLVVKGEMTMDQVMK